MKHLVLNCAALSLTLAAAGAASATERPGEGITVRPVEGAVLEERFQNQIIYRALEELGYTIADPASVDYQTMHLAIGSGDADFTTAHWDPLHQGFFEGAGGEAVMTKVGHFIAGALQGYLVDTPSYEAGVTNIADLKDPAVAARFDANGDGKADLAGCPPGWGCEAVIEHQLTEYGLRDTVTHNQGAFGILAGDTLARHQSGQPILYFTYTPYWLSGVLVPGDNVQWLEVPYTSLPDGSTGNTMYEGKNLGMTVNEIRILASNQFLEANPAAAKLFELAVLDINDVSAENYKMQQGEDSIEAIDGHVDAWIETNRATYDSWIEAARAAAD